MFKQKAGGVLWFLRPGLSLATGACVVREEIVSLGGLELVRQVAEEVAIHHLLAKDDKGNGIVAASRKSFKGIC